MAKLITGKGVIPFAVPGTSVPVTRDHFLRLETLNRAGSVVLQVLVRFLHADGRVTHMQFQQRPGSALSKETDTYQLTDGWIIGIGLAVQSGDVQRGECFCTLRLQLGGAFDEQPFQTFISDYVYTSYSLSWPGSAIRDSLDGKGYMLSATQASPGAGLDLQYTIPTNTRVRLIGIKLAMATSATAGNRYLVMRAIRGTTVLWSVPSNQAQPASTTVTYHWSSGLGFGGLGGMDAMLPLPTDLYMVDGDVLETDVIGRDAGDTIGSAEIYLEQWIQD